MPDSHQGTPDGAIMFRDVSFNADVIREKLYIKVVGVT
jgi:hypothetical protein